MENFIKKYNVSRETLAKLSRFADLLKVWQTKMNLVSNHSLAEIWTRHIADSYQLYQYLNSDAKCVYDIGSGAGFPAIVLAIASEGDSRPTAFTLIESITKKTVYLNAVKNELGLKNVQILNARSENLGLPAADFITARAVANLKKLFGFSYPLTNKNTVLIFPKGKTYEEELADARQNWLFNVDVKKSEIDDEGVVLIISNLRKKR